MRALFEFIMWIFWAIGSGLWTLYHTWHSRKLGSLVINGDPGGHFVCRRCRKIFTFEVPWETR